MTHFNFQSLSLKYVSDCEKEHTRAKDKESNKDSPVSGAASLDSDNRFELLVASKHVHKHHAHQTHKAKQVFVPLFMRPFILQDPS